MYGSLALELDKVKEPMFHVVDGPANTRLRRAVTATRLAAPRSYKDFVLKFGNAKLYREDTSIDSYHIGVLASMRAAETHDGVPLLGIGHYRGHPAFFRPDLLKGERESPVFEWIAGPHSVLHRAAGGFGEWIEARCHQARKKYKKRRWAEILCGPAPFNKRELEIAEARKRFRWQVVGITRSGKLKFEVHNGSRLTLRYLSIGISNKAGDFHGGIFLPVSKVNPRQTRVIECDCYKTLLRPEDAVPFAYPAPGPEDRHRYLEFQDRA